MENILVFLSIVFLIDCAIIPKNHIKDMALQNKIIAPTEPVRDYTDNIETIQDQPETGNIRNGDQLKRCSDYDIVSSSYQPDAVLALSRREINLLERNRERCEMCRNNPICKNDITICRTCKRICDSVAEQMMATTTTTESNEIPQEPILGQSFDAITTRFGAESTNHPRYFSIGAVDAGPTKDLVAQLFNVDDRDDLEQLIVLGKLRDGGKNEMVGSQLFIWDLGGVFGSTANQPVAAEIHDIQNDEHHHSDRIDLARELNRELNKAIRDKKKELGTNRLSRQQIDNLINATITEIIRRRNDTVGCSLEEEIEPIIDLRNRPEPIHSIANPPVIQNTFDPKLGANQMIDDTIVTERVITATEAQQMPESDNQINGARESYASSEDSSGYSSSSESIEDSYVGANQAGLPKLTPNPGLADLQKNIVKIVEDGFKIPSGLQQRDNALKATNPQSVSQQSPAGPENLQGAIEKIVEESLKVPNNDMVGEQNPMEPKNLQQAIENVVEESLRTPQQGPPMNKIDDNPMEPKNLQKAVQNIVEESLNVPKVEATQLPTRNRITGQDDVEKIAEESVKTPQDPFVAQQNPNLPMDEMEGNPMEPKNPQMVTQQGPAGQGILQGEIEKIVEDSLKVPSQQSRNLPVNKMEDNPMEPKNLQQTVGNVVDESFRTPKIESQQMNKIEDNPSETKNLQQAVPNAVEESLKVPKAVAPQIPQLPTRNRITGQDVQKIAEESLQTPQDPFVAQQRPNLPTQKEENPTTLEPHKALQQEIQKLIDDSLKMRTPTEQIVGQPIENQTEAHLPAAAHASKTPQVFPYDLSRPIPDTPEFDGFRHLGQQLTQPSDTATTPIPVAANEVGAPIMNRQSPDRKFHSFGAIIPVPGPPDSTNTRSAVFLGRDVELPLRMQQNPDGIMQLSVDMEKLCNCKDKSCMKTHDLDDISNNLLRNSETVPKTSDIMKRSPKIENFDQKFEQNDNYLDLEEQMNKLHKVVEKFEEDNENLLEESTKILLQNVENEGKVHTSVDLINKMLKWMKNVVTEKHN